MFKTDNHKSRGSYYLILLVIAFVFAGCEGITGSEGPEGPRGPIGPAGEDGSMLYAGEGPPTSDIGDIGDYYLNTNTGEYHGPKSEEGWGEPIIVLMGNDGEDGNQIHSGNGAPGVTLGQVGDFYI